MLRNGKYFLLLFVSLSSFLFSQKLDEAFNGDLSKSPQFQYEKVDFDTLFAHYFKEPFPLSIASDYKIGLQLKLLIDTSGNVVQVKFHEFELISSLNINNENPQGIKAYQAMRDSIRKIVYLTNGMWNCKLKKGEKQKTEVLVSTTLRKRSARVFNQTAEEQLNQKGTVIYYTQVRQKKINPDFYYNYGVSLINKEKYELAIVYFKSVISSFPEDIDARFNIGVCYQKLGLNQEACKNWNECVKMGDKSVLKILDSNNCKEFEKNSKEK